MTHPYHIVPDVEHWVPCAACDGGKHKGSLENGECLNCYGTNDEWADLQPLFTLLHNVVVGAALARANVLAAGPQNGEQG